MTASKGQTRMNYYVPDVVHRKAKSAAEWRGVTLRQFFVDALAAASESHPGEAPDRASRSKRGDGSSQTQMHYPIPNEVHHQAKSAASLRGITLRQFVIDALAAASEKPAEERAADRAARGRRAS